MSYAPAALLSIAAWGALALLMVNVQRLPLFFVLAAAFSVAALLGAPAIRRWRASFLTYAVGVYGIFGFHVFYIIALSAAPPVEANLIVEAWPLLIVLLTPLIVGGYRLRWRHLLGSSMASIGAVLIVTGGHPALNIDNLTGYLPAAAAALVWASYSLLTRRIARFPTAAVGGFCAVSALLALALHLTFDPPVSPTAKEWITLALLGIGPLGGAFYSWDYALKHGDPRVIGALSYLIPLIATLLLVTLGRQKLTLSTAAAMVLIIAGSLIGSLDLFRSKKNAQVNLRAADRDV